MLQLPGCRKDLVVMAIGFSDNRHVKYKASYLQPEVQDHENKEALCDIE